MTHAIQEKDMTNVPNPGDVLRVSSGLISNISATNITLSLIVNGQKVSTTSFVTSVSLTVTYGQGPHHIKWLLETDGDIAWTQRNITRVVPALGILSWPTTYHSAGTHQFDIILEPILHPETTPTYFETLDKLDQWSSAQYVPYGKSGDKLNL